MSTQLLEKKKWTYEDYAQLDGEQRYQVIEGELVMAPSPVTRHQFVSGELEFLIREFVKKHQLGKVFDPPLDVILSPDNVYQPDILFISNENMNILAEKNVQGAPDLIVEILSPGTAVYDLGIKKEVYERSGVRELWIVDPETESVLLYQNGNKGFEITDQAKKEGTIKSALLKGFKVDIKELFAA